jgi:hypothetical protein
VFFNFCNKSVVTLLSPSPFTTLRVVVCEVWTHKMGWELRLQVDGEGLLMSSVTRSGAEMLARVEEWHRAMLEQGWTA